MPNAPELPILPPTRARALTILSNPSPEPTEIADIVRADPALTAAVLRASNSVWSSPRAPIDAADRAIVRIGTREALRVVGVAVLSSTFTNLRAAALDPFELCRHVVACALLTEEAVDPTVSRGVRAAAYTAGLLHDIGRLAMADSNAEAYRRVAAAVARGADVREAEREQFGTDHVEFGVQVGEAWTISGDLLDAIGAHHGEGSAKPLAHAVRRSRPIAWSLGIGDGLVAPTEDADADSDDRTGADVATEAPKLSVDDDLVIYRLGGEKPLMARVRWLSSAVTSSEAAA